MATKAMQPPQNPSNKVSCAREESDASWFTGICQGRTAPILAEVATKVVGAALILLAQVVDEARAVQDELDEIV
jgi:hypothetical protein